MAKQQTRHINKKLRRRRLIIALLIALPICGFVLFSSRGVVARISLELQSSNLQAELEAATLRRDSLKQVIRRLQNDTLLIEQLARERYGMIKPGEKVYVLEKPGK